MVGVFHIRDGAGRLVSNCAQIPIAFILGSLLVFTLASPGAGQAAASKSLEIGTNASIQQVERKVEYSAHEKSAPVMEIWIHYFGALAETVAVVAALLVALVIIRLESLAHSLAMIEKSIAQIFYNINAHDAYHEAASDHFLNSRWRDYFHSVSKLATQRQTLFSQGGSYTESKAFLDSLVARGGMLEETTRRLQSDLSRAAMATAVMAGLAVLLVPVGQWASAAGLTLAWVVSGVLLLGVLAVYLRLVRSFFRAK